MHPSPRSRGPPLPRIKPPSPPPRRATAGRTPARLQRPHARPPTVRRGAYAQTCWTFGLHGLVRWRDSALMPESTRRASRHRPDRASWFGMVAATVALVAAPALSLAACAVADPGPASPSATPRESTPPTTPPATPRPTVTPTASEPTPCPDGARRAQSRTGSRSACPASLASRSAPGAIRRASSASSSSSQEPVTAPDSACSTNRIRPSIHRGGGAG